VLDHLSIQCADFGRSVVFYDAVLAALGGHRVMDFPTPIGQVIGYGVGQKPSFWIGPQTTGTVNREVHIAFQADNRAAVRAFFDAAVGLGAEVLHAPRIWTEYHPTYYGAFVRDPDGNNVEAVCHLPE
jgi:catechol 2,3-dioxygenase-like lactoylglutathione lyase family enzyme